MVNKVCGHSANYFGPRFSYLLQSNVIITMQIITRVAIRPQFFRTVPNSDAVFLLGKTVT